MSTASRMAPLESKQWDLFGALPAQDVLHRSCASDTGRRFITGKAHEIFLGTTRLEDWLKQAGQNAPFVVARLLGQQDWQAFERRYAGRGRAPYLPRQMMGLILYGVMQGVHSLRELERLARLDLGCMWVSGGITPDHANVGRFIVLHEDSLTHEFFESLTRAILKANGSSSARLAGDGVNGTVIEAARSRYNLLNQEAVRDRAKAAEAAPVNVRRYSMHVWALVKTGVRAPRACASAARSPRRWSNA